MKKGMSIIGILLVIGLAVAISGCTSTTPTNNTSVTPAQTNTTPAPAQTSTTPAQTDTSTATSDSSTTKEAANVNPVDGSIGTYMGMYSGYPGYESSDGTILWICDKKTHTKMYGYLADFKANGNQWNDGDLTTVAWNS